MIAHKVRLTKINSVHNNLRTDSVEGLASNLPKEGNRFTLVGNSLTPEMTARIVTTSEVQVVEKNESGFLFHTENSVYKLEILGTEEIK